MYIVYHMPPWIYWRIIIVRGGKVFMDFLGHSYSRIYVPTNVYQINELSCILMHQTSYSQYYISLNHQNFDNPRTLVCFLSNFYNMQYLNQVLEFQF